MVELEAPAENEAAEEYELLPVPEVVALATEAARQPVLSPENTPRQQLLGQPLQGSYVQPLESLG